jgi:hypothetical protein
MLSSCRSSAILRLTSMGGGMLGCPVDSIITSLPSLFSLSLNASIFLVGLSFK